MKPGSLLMVAFLAPALFCHAQDQPAAGQPAAQNTAAPAAEPAAAPSALDSAKPAAPGAAAQAPAGNSYVIGASDVITVTDVYKRQFHPRVQTVRAELRSIAAW